MKTNQIKILIKLPNISKIILGMLMLFVFFSPGCKKTENVVIPISDLSNSVLRNKFFNAENTNPEIKALANDIKKQDSLFGFVPDFIKRNGYPRWDKVLYNVQGSSQTAQTVNSIGTNSLDENDPRRIYFIPLQAENSEVRGYITAYKHDNTKYTYRLYNTDSLSNVDAQSLQTKSNLLTTQAIIGYFEKVLNGKNEIAVTSPSNGVIRNANVSFTVAPPGIANTQNNLGDCDVTIIVTTTYEWHDFSWGGGSWVEVECVTTIMISCDPETGGGSSGGTSPGTPPTGSTDPGSGIPGSGTTGGTSGGTSIPPADWWWLFGTGWPWQAEANANQPSDPNWYWWWTNGGSASGLPPFSSTAGILASQLGLDWTTAYWLEQNPSISNSILEYLNNSSEPSKYEIAKDHITTLVRNPDYLSFVNSYSSNNLGMWWENDSWLSDPNNFNLDITNNEDPKLDLTAQEIALIKKFPIQAYIMYKNIDISFSMSTQKMGTGNGLNNKKDAFRHAFFNAINTRDVPPRLLLDGTYNSATQIVFMFSNAHESEVPNQLLLEKEMDLHNNEVGITYCWNCYPGISSDESIANAILIKLNSGELVYLKPLLTPAQDINFNGAGGVIDLQTATHGIYLLTEVVPTNQ